MKGQLSIESKCPVGGGEAGNTETAISEMAWLSNMKAGAWAWRTEEEMER